MSCYIFENDEWYLFISGSDCSFIRSFDIISVTLLKDGCSVSNGVESTKDPQKRPFFPLFFASLFCNQSLSKVASIHAHAHRRPVLCLFFYFSPVVLCKDSATLYFCYVDFIVSVMICLQYDFVVYDLQKYEVRLILLRVRYYEYEVR